MMKMLLAKYRCIGCVSLEERDGKLVCVKSDHPIEDIDDCTTVPYGSIKQKELDNERRRSVSE